MLRRALAACLLALPSLAYDAPVPATVRVCVQAYPPFVLTRVRSAQRSAAKGCVQVALRRPTARLTLGSPQDWQGKSIDDLLFPSGFGEPASMSGEHAVPRPGI